MASEQPQEGQETKAVSENEEGKGSVSSPIEGSKQPSGSSGISSQ